MRIIDADAMYDRFVNQSTIYDAIDLPDMLAEMPTADAIPIEWLCSQIKNSPNDIESVYDEICISELIQKWQREQKGNYD